MTPTAFHGGVHRQAWVVAFLTSMALSSALAAQETLPSTAPTLAAPSAPRLPLVAALQLVSENPSPGVLPVRPPVSRAVPNGGAESKAGERPESEQEGERERGEGEEERDVIETDRDSFTPATTTAGKGRLIVESAYSFLDNRGVKETHSFPELLLRYGLTERLELRLGGNYEVGGAASEISGIDLGTDLPRAKRLERESNLNYGAKLQVTRQVEWVPTSALNLQAFTPTSGKATDTQFVGTYVFGWELPHRWKLDAAMRYATGSEGEDHFSEWAPSVVLKVPLGEQINVHAEYFGILSTGKAEEFTHHFFSPGIHYLITPNLEVGVRVGWGLNDQSPRFFANAGFGWRF